MRHRVFGRKLGRTSNERRALFRSLIRALILQEQLTTTVAKAKAIKPLVDKLFTLAKSGSLSGRRRVMAKLADRQAADKLCQELSARSAKRTSGFTRIRRVGQRLGDNSLMAQIELVDKKESKK